MCKFRFYGLILILIIGAIVIFSCFFNKVQNVDVYIIAGQSNALGFSPVADLPESEQKEYENVKIYQHIINSQSEFNNKFVSVDIGQGYAQEYFGLELGVAKYLSQYYNNGKVANIIKHADGGTTLQADWNHKTEPKGKNYTAFITTINNGLKALRKQNLNPVLKGVIWLQGESDAMDETSAHNYEQNLKDFISSIRTELKVGNLKFVIGKIQPDNELMPYRDIVIRRTAGGSKH